MAFEIMKCEGWGRMGLAFGKDGFITPNIVSPCFFDDSSHDQFFSLPTSIKCQKNGIQPTSRISDLKIKENPNFSFIPSCFTYPSLQLQEKSLEDVTCFDDFFPVDISKITVQRASFHLLPWDLPTLHLGQFNKYLEKLNEIDDLKLKNHTKIMLNVPLTPEILKIKLLPLKSTTIAAVCLGDLSSLLTNPSLLIKYLTLVKSWISPDKILYAPAIPSSYIPILVYLGIDLFDLLIPEFYKANPVKQSDSVLEYNPTIESFMRVVELTQSALSSSKLRDLSRILANSYPPIKALLRISDSKLTLEEGTPLYARTLYCTDETDFTRPEVTRFRERIRTRYYPSSHITGVIFLPCSAKKPYSQSRSHNLFRKVISQSLKGKRHSIEEIILTSPLGVVPRNLEYSFPAAHYDIPVTGEWSQIERNNLVQDLIGFLGKLKTSIPLVGYVNGAVREIFEETCEQQNLSILLPNQNVKSLTSKEGLKEFSTLLKEAFVNVSNTPRIPIQLTFLRMIADFQFGKRCGSFLIPNNVRIHGRKERGLRVQLDGEHLLTFRPETGLLTLSLIAGRRLLDHTRNVVTFDGQRIEGSTIFTKAIISADSEIRPKDEVLVVNKKGDLLAVGVSHLSGDLLVKMKFGKGINIRQKVKQSASE
ncbi:MAG: DUF5591 domain-containing protein [Candidatus Hodarchaeota archaeon]